MGNDVVCTFFVSSFTAEGVISKDVMYVVAADALCVGRVNRESEFAGRCVVEGRRVV